MKTAHPANTGAYYELIVQGQLDDHWLTWFDGLELENRPDGFAKLTGFLPDQSALQGVINQVFDLNLKLVLVRRFEESDLK